MQGKKRILLLIAIMVGVSVGVGGIVLFSLYRTSFDQQRRRLVEIVQSQALMIEAMARFDASHYAADDPEGALTITLRKLKYPHEHFKGFGNTGEFTLARREGDQIVFLLSQRHRDLDNRQPVPFSSKLAEPMQRALSGESGTLVGLDYRGQRVLAAYKPVTEHNLGIVVKIDVAEVRAPFIKAGLLAGAGGLVFILLGNALFLRIGNPMVQHIEESERKYRGVFEAAADKLLLIDRNGSVLDANPAACAGYGFSRDEFIGLNAHGVVHSDNRESFDTALAESMQGKSYFAESVHLRKNGTPFPVEFHLSPMVHRSGPAALAVARDITQRKLDEERLRESEARYRRLSVSLEEMVGEQVAKLRQAETLAAIGQMVSTVAHEVRNPVHVIRTGVAALSHPPRDERERQEILEEIDYGARMLEGTISELLHYSRPLKLEFSAVPVKDIVEAALKLLTGKIEHINTHVELERGDEEIHVDTVKFTEVLVNIMANAVDAMPLGGSLRIRSRVFERNGAKLLEMSVADTGHGINEKHLDDIYRPFFTTKVRGTGLGIPLCKKILDAHSGTLYIKSKVGEGTTVELTLPIDNRL